jgi:hypothetical protein
MMLVKVAQIGCLASLLMAGVNSSARCDRATISGIYLTQTSGDQDSRKSWRLETHRLRCRGTACFGRLPLMLEQKIYHYDVVATFYVEGAKYLQLNIDLHPTVPGCGTRCQPGLIGIPVTLSLVRETRVTVPVRQRGNFDPSGPWERMSDAIYQIQKEPVAYLDVSLEFE